jgi:hypothetical protein
MNVFAKPLPRSWNPWIKVQYLKRRSKRKLKGSSHTLDNGKEANLNNQRGLHFIDVDR